MKAGLDPTQTVVEQLPPKGPDLKVSFALKGEDLIGPQAPGVKEILAQAGIQISVEAEQAMSQEMATQMLTGLREADGTVIKQVQEHGGPAEQVRPLSKKQGDQTGDRPGPKTTT